jgi:hypothetical protein
MCDFDDPQTYTKLRLRNAGAASYFCMLQTSGGGREAARPRERRTV